MSLSRWLLIGLVGAGLAACGGEAPSADAEVEPRSVAATPDEPGLFDERSDLKVFQDLLERSGTFDFVEGANGVTIIAPTDDAFAALPAGTVDALRREDLRGELRALLDFHLVLEVLPAPADGEDLDISVATRSGPEVRIRRQGPVLSVGGAVVIERLTPAEGKTVLVVDQVLLPPEQ